MVKKLFFFAFLIFFLNNVDAGFWNAGFGSGGGYGYGGRGGYGNFAVHFADQSVHTYFKI